MAISQSRVTTQHKRLVKLQKNVQYPTYQFYGVMANRKTDLNDGLRFAALKVLAWIRLRLEGNVIPDKLNVPMPEHYKDSTIKLEGCYINDGYILNIISIPEDGIWSMQLIEPDLGSPSSRKSKRDAIPGRLFITNVGLYINKKTEELECGFQVIISSPISAINNKAEVYRLRFIRELAENEIFGLKQIDNVTFNAVTIKSGKDYIHLKDEILECESNQMPCVVFNSSFNRSASEIANLDIAVGDIRSSIMNPIVPNKIETNLKKIKLDLPSDLLKIKLNDKNGKEEILAKETLSEEVQNPVIEDAELLAKESFTFGRVFIADENIIKMLLADLTKNMELVDKEVYVFYPKKYGKSITAPDIADLKEILTNCQRDVKSYDFGNVKFISAAREYMAVKDIETAKDFVEKNDYVKKLVKGNEELFNENETLRQELKNNLLMGENLSELTKWKELEAKFERQKSLLEEQGEKIKKLNEKIEKYENAIDEKNESIIQLIEKVDKYKAELTDKENENKLLNQADEKEFFYGEQNDLVINILKGSLNKLGDNTRAKKLLQAIIDSNKEKGFGRELNENIKKAIKSKDYIKALTEIGFSIARDDNHYVVMYQGREFTTSKTPSDYRSAQNFISEILRIISVYRNY